MFLYLTYRALSYLISSNGILSPTVCLSVYLSVCFLGRSVGLDIDISIDQSYSLSQQSNPSKRCNRSNQSIRSSRSFHPSIHPSVHLCESASPATQSPHDFVKVLRLPRNLASAAPAAKSVPDLSKVLRVTQAHVAKSAERAPTREHRIIQNPQRFALFRHSAPATRARFFCVEKRFLPSEQDWGSLSEALPIPTCLIADLFLCAAYEV